MPKDLRRSILDRETIRTALNELSVADARVRWPCLAPDCPAVFLTETAIRLHRMEDHKFEAIVKINGSSSTRIHDEMDTNHVVDTFYSVRRDETTDYPCPVQPCIYAFEKSEGIARHTRIIHWNFENTPLSLSACKIGAVGDFETNAWCVLFSDGSIFYTQLVSKMPFVHLENLP